MRHALPGGILLAGVVLAIVVPGEAGLEDAVGLGGVCACVVLLNLLLRLGASGDRDRDREAAARDYYDAHGRWPEDRRPPRSTDSPRRTDAQRGEAPGTEPPGRRR